MSPGLAHSVQVRLVRHAQAMGVDPSLVPVRFRERYDRYAQNHWDREHRYPNNNPLYQGDNWR